MRGLILKLIMPKIGLHSRLFLSHLLVMLVAIISLVTIGKISSPKFFVSYLEQLEGPGFTLRYARTNLIRGFEIAWNRSTFWSVIIGTSAAGGLSYWIAKRIMQPLTQMEEITQKFAKGQLDQRVPGIEIPELDQLGISFNQMANRLEGVETRRRELITDLTHELRTPLTIVHGYLEELADGKIAPSDEIYHRLALETKRLERLVNDLQELSKAESGYLPIELKPINLRPLCANLVENFAEQLLEEGPTMGLDCPDEIPLVLADLDRMEQVLVNLIGNAMRHTESGSITLQVRVQKPRLLIAVIDTGSGIAPTDLLHIFERFWQRESPGKISRPGTGVGLAIAKRLIELQGGTIEVESQLGKGSIFRVSLPLVYES